MANNQQYATTMHKFQINDKVVCISVAEKIDCACGRDHNSLKDWLRKDKTYTVTGFTKNGFLKLQELDDQNQTPCSTRFVLAHPKLGVNMLLHHVVQREIARLRDGT